MTTTPFREWFNLADRQRTGMITGQDAVQFFSRSGLHKRLLAQVWYESEQPTHPPSDSLAD